MSGPEQLFWVVLTGSISLEQRAGDLRRARYRGNWVNGWDTVPQSRVEPSETDLRDCSVPTHVWCVED